MDTKELKQSLDNIYNALLSINNTLLNLNTPLANTEANGNAQKPLKTLINASLSLNATNKISNQPSKDDLFDLSKIEYNEGSWITFSDFYNACCLDRSVPNNHFSKYFKQTNFYKNNGILNTRMGKKKIVKNIRLRLDNSNQQA